MVQGTPQFTPAQVLEAGRRAEAEGKLDYAVQFYRHLATHYPSTSEAQAAREGLQRLAAHHPAAGAALSGLAARGSDQATTQPANPRPAPASVNGSSDSPQPPPQHHLGPPPQAQPPAGLPPRPAAPPPQLGIPQRPLATDHQPMQRGPRASEIELPGDRYRAGRWLARLFTAVGLLVTMLGLVILLIAVTGGLMPKIVSALGGPGMMAYAFGLYGGPSLLVIGLVLMLVGQVSRAVLDNANATQDVLILERGRQGAR